jgi:uncharacterized protein YjdB
MNTRNLIVDIFANRFSISAKCGWMVTALLVLAGGQAHGQSGEAIAVAPSQLQFMNTQTGFIGGPEEVTVTNNSAIAISGLTVTASGDFATKTTCHGSLKAGASCQASVTFNPVAPGSRMGDLTVTYTGQPAPLIVNLWGQAYTLVSIAVAPQTASIPIGAGRQFHVLGSYSDGSVQDITAAVSWTSSNPAALTVANTGVATGIAAGSAQITATWGTITAPVNVNVTTATLVSMAVDTTNLSLPGGYAQQFNAVGSYSDGTQLVLTNQVAWTSSSPALAPVSASGLVTTLGPGTALITAALGSVSSSAPLTVTGVTLQSIAISPATLSMAKYTLLQLQATGTYSDGSTRSLTNLASWSSSATSVATVSAIGRISSGLAGSAAISASFGGLTASMPVMVTSARLNSIVVTPSKLSLPAGASSVYTASGTFNDGSTQDVSLLVHWISSNTAVSTVANTLQSEGLANTLASGTAAITAAYMPSTFGKSTLAVSAAALVSIAITPANSTVAEGSALQFTATGTFANKMIGNITQSVVWSASNPSALLVGNDPGSQGFGYGLAAGGNTVTATGGSVGGSTSFTMAAPALISISVSPASATIVAGATQQFTATGTYGNGTTQDLTGTVTWSSSSSAAATVSNSPGTGGLALGAGQGQATVTAASGGISGSGQLIVSPAQLVSISVTPANPTITAGGSQQFAATGTYTDGSTQDLTTTATWSASPANGATIGNAAGSQGLAQGLAAGAVTITATSGAIAGFTVLAVNPAPPQLKSISISPSSATIFVGSSQQFAATGTYSDGSTQNLTTTLNWSVSPSTVATISDTAGSQGLAQAPATGEATITATSGTISATADLSVMPLLASITISPSSASLSVGGTQQFTATGVYSDGSTEDLTAAATWTTNPATLATIGSGPSSPGFVHAIGTGSGTISATFASTTGAAPLTVCPALVSIAVTPPNPSILISSNQQFAATGTYSDGSTQDLTNQVTWSVAPPSIATISPSGFAQALTSGPATITAALGAVLSSTVLTVSAPTLVSLVVSPTAPSIAVGATQQLVATGTYSDGSTQNLTSSVTWVSSSPAVVAIGSSGLATAIAAGTTTISASVGAVVASINPFVVLSAGPAGAPPICSPAATGLPPLSSPVTLPALPQSCTVPAYPVAASTVTVASATDLQAALNAAVCGQLINVQAGVEYVGNFLVPALACPSNNPVLVAGSAIASIPQYTIPARTLAGTSMVPTLATPNGSPALQISDGAAGWYFAGLEITLTPSSAGVYPIVDIGDYTTSVDALPAYITFDRCLVHPSSNITSYVRGGIDLNAVNGAVMFSNIWGIVAVSQDTQAINIQNTTGPILISNNDLEATGEIVLTNTSCVVTGYAGSGIPSCPTPSDITITRNHFIKQVAWQNAPAGCVPNGVPSCYDVKNSLECKMCQRELVDSNWFDTTFAEGQAEFVIMNCPAGAIGSSPYVCTDFTVTNNLFEHGPSLGVFAGNGSTQTGQRILFRNNLALDLSGPTWGGTGISFQVENTNGFIADHNTILNTPPTYLVGLEFEDQAPSTDTNFQYTNNFQYASPTAAGMSPGQTIASLPNPTFGETLFVGDYWPNLVPWGNPSTPAYPTGIITLSSTAAPVSGQPACNYANKPILQCWPLDWAMVGFIDFTGGNAGTDLPGMQLSPTSPYHNAATDGTDVGVNVSALLAAINGVN